MSDAANDREEALAFYLRERDKLFKENPALAAEYEKGCIDGVAELRGLLLEVQLAELNGRLCPRPESAKDRCCPSCRDLWRRIDLAVAPEKVSDRG